MRGIASRRPGPHAARAMIGGHMLLLIQSLLIVRSGGEISAMLWGVIGLTSIAALAALVLALLGEPSGRGMGMRRPIAGRRSHDR